MNRHYVECNPRLLLFILSFFFIGFSAVSQPIVLDQTVAVVGDEMLLQSDLDVQLQGLGDTGKSADMACFVLDKMIGKRMLLTRAKVDSLAITDAEVEEELTRRIQYFVSQMGSEEALEKFYKRSIPQIKDEFRSSIRDQIMTERMEAKVYEGLEVTPNEVRRFFNRIPQDSLPYYNTELEVGQIVLFPRVSGQQRLDAIAKLKSIRAEIMAGAKFSTKALVYSDDPGSATKGGNLGPTPASSFVPQYAAAAKALRKDSISGIVETRFGFHIIQLLERRGDMIDTRHILIKPKVTQEANDATEITLDSLRLSINKRELTFAEAVTKFSQDDETKNRGGILAGPQNNSSRIPADEIDPAIYFIVSELQVGTVSAPQLFKTPEGLNAYRILYLRSKTPPHRANLTDDYAQMKNLALQYKKIQQLEKWQIKYIPSTFIQVNPAYRDCGALTKYNKSSGLSLGE